MQVRASILDSCVKYLKQFELVKSHAILAAIDAHSADLFIEFLTEHLSFRELTPHDVLMKVDKEADKTCGGGLVTGEFDRRRCQYVDAALQDDVECITSVPVIEQHRP